MRDLIRRLLESCPATWEEIGSDYISHESSALTAVTPLGWQFLLPAYMIWHLQNYRQCPGVQHCGQCHLESYVGREQGRAHRRGVPDAFSGASGRLMRSSRSSQTRTMIRAWRRMRRRRETPIGPGQDCRLTGCCSRQALPAAERQCVGRPGNAMATSIPR